MRNKATALCLSILLSACASTDEKSATKMDPSNYETDFSYPKTTKNLVLVEQKIYDEPLYGSSVRYANKYYEKDNILVFAYPIRSYVWQDNLYNILAGEMNNALDDIDSAIDQGLYQQRIGREVEDFSFFRQGELYEGLRAQTKIILKSGTPYQSYTYLFTQKDKFVKFSISLPWAMDLPAPDHFVTEVLPNLEVPDESNYMVNLRKLHQKEYQKTR
ncbi:hypothetical protein HR060_15935 [Catenovulum sp. SM1970]|uniref:hypothetical protein n=1 Tax=Marinifaba aquimaris TaxID=2741323 RepID=UPI001572A922|nr:hypothetical protein [Marinifaba aquimaris]NTS78343.1 hypothetical protein [Marinifaba aquimaris]